MRVGPYFSAGLCKCEQSKLTAVSQASWEYLTVQEVRQAKTRMMIELILLTIPTAGVDGRDSRIAMGCSGREAT